MTAWALDQVRSARLARDLRDAVDERDFGAVLDRSGRMGPSPARIHQTPNVDAAVIELDDRGRPRAAADVLLSPQYPHGVIVALDENLATDQVRWRWRDTDEWYCTGGLGTRDIVAGREHAPIDFMSPYPASVIKLMVGFGVLRMVDQGRIDLDGRYSFRPRAPHPACGEPATRTIRQFFDEMLTMSRNDAACALIKMLHDHGAMDELNRTFAELGLDTLRLTGTDPANGGTWTGSTMGALDTAKFLLLINGGPGTLWTAPDGRPVTRDALGAPSRRLFRQTLAEQGHNDMLSTVNWSGRTYPAPGIAHLVAERWIDPQDGTVRVGDVSYGCDVRPANRSAEVTFAHKTGWTDCSGGDAGIVHALPGRPPRDYIVVVLSNLGTDYVDADRPDDPPGVYPVPYTEKHAQLGRAIDRIMTRFRAG